MYFHPDEFIWQYILPLSKKKKNKNIFFLCAGRNFTISHPKPSLEGSNGCHVTHGCDCAIYSRAHPLKPELCYSMTFKNG